MKPTYLHQRYLPAPLPQSTQPFPDQPFSNYDLDGWLTANCADAYRLNVAITGYLFLADVPQDQVLCSVTMMAGEYQDEIYGDDVMLYTLFLAVDIPESSGINPIFLSSPVVALATFESRTWDPDTPAADNPDLPAWTQMIPGWPLLFRQPRGAMAEVFAAVAFWNDNYFVGSLPKEVMEWVFATACGTPAELKPLAPGYVTPLRPKIVNSPPRHSGVKRQRNFEDDVTEYDLPSSPTPGSRRSDIHVSHQLA